MLISKVTQCTAVTWHIVIWSSPTRGLVKYGEMVGDCEADDMSCNVIIVM